MSNTASISQGQEILALQDELTGALIGLARSCGNNPKTENTDEIIIEGLVHTITNSNTGAAALKAMIEKVREEKNTVAPDCAVCAAPCGITSEYDVSTKQMCAAWRLQSFSESGRWQPLFTRRSLWGKWMQK